MEDIGSVKEDISIVEYLNDMYSKVKEDNAVTGKIGRIRIVMFVEDEHCVPDYDGPR